MRDSGRGAARLARLHGVQEVGGSNPLAPTRTLVRGSFRFKIGGGFPIKGTVQIPFRAHVLSPRQEGLSQEGPFLYERFLIGE